MIVSGLRTLIRHTSSMHLEAVLHERQRPLIRRLQPPAS